MRYTMKRLSIVLLISILLVLLFNSYMLYNGGYTPVGTECVRIPVDDVEVDSGGWPII